MLEPRETPDAPALGDESADDAGTASERAVRCAACGHALTTRKEEFCVNGAHAHTFKNPASLDYRVGCFRRAPGCRVVGEASSVWTWFPGYAWRIGLCGRCGAHVGWTFAKDDASASFAALVLDRISES